MIAPSTSSLADQLALIPDRAITTTLRRKRYPSHRQNQIPAQQFERWYQVCGECGCIDTLIDTLIISHSHYILQVLSNYKNLSLRESLVEAGPLDKLCGLQARHVDITSMKKNQTRHAIRHQGC